LRPPPSGEPPRSDSGYSLRPPPVAESPELTGYSLRPPPSGEPPRSGSGYSLRPPPTATTTPRPKPKTTVRPLPKPKRRSRVGRIVALVIASLFALIGLVPLLAALLVRSPFVQAWAAGETTKLLEAELGARATFRSRATLWPLAVTVQDVEVESHDGGSPFVEVEEATVRPRLFSLISGRIDAGEVEVVGLRARVVLKDGKLVNFKPTLPEDDGSESKPLERAPLRSLSITDAALDLTVDDMRTKVAEVDVDLAFGEGLAFELAARAARGTFTWQHPDPAQPERSAVDEDRLCQLELRSGFDPKTNLFTIRRFALKASADLDPAPGTRPACELEPGDWRAVAVELGTVELPTALLSLEGVGLIRGRASLKAPIALLHRFVKFPHTTGAVEVDVQAERAAFELLPRLSGTVGASNIGLDGKIFSDRADLRVRLDGKRLIANDITARWSDGDFRIDQATLDLGDPTLPLVASDVLADHVELQGLLRDLGAHPQSHVGWRLDRVSFASFEGTLNPLDLSGFLTAETSGFGIYDRPSHKPDRKRMLSLDRADITGTLAIRPDACYLEKMHAVTGGSSIFTTVKLGFDSAFGLEVGRGTTIDFSELSPLISVPIGGLVEIEAQGTGTFEFPRIEGDLTIADFLLGGFQAGDIRRAHAVFVPLALDITNVELAKNQSVIQSPKLRVDFDAGPDVLVDAEVDTRPAPSLGIRDFFEVFQFDQDPRFKGIDGIAKGLATVHYAIGGEEDKCGTGTLHVKAQTEVESPTLFGEKFERGSLAVDFRWDDSEAGGDGMDIYLPALAVYDGNGSVVGEARIQNGNLSGTMFGSGLALSSIEGTGALGSLLDGELSFIAKLSGTLNRMAADLDVSLSPLRFGANRLPGSRFAVRMTPDPAPPVYTERVTGCGRKIGPPFSLEEYEKDLPDGAFAVKGQLFGGQLELSDLQISKQRAKVIKGQVGIVKLDLGTLAAVHPKVALTGRVPNAHLSGEIDIARLELENLASADVRVDLSTLELAQGSRSVKLAAASGPVRLSEGNLSVPQLDFVVADSRRGARVAFNVEGQLRSPFGPAKPDLDVRIEMTPFNLAGLKNDLPQLDRIEGLASGGIQLSGELSAPKVSGNLRLRDGSLALVGFPTTIEDIAVDVSLGDGELRVTKASASVGAGTVDISGRIPLIGLSYGTGTATITGRGLKLPAGEGIDVVVDADLDLTLPAEDRKDGALPDLRGRVDVSSFSYTRPISLIGELTKTIGKTEVTDFDPAGDFLSFNVLVDSQRPLRVDTELAEIQLEFVDPGLTLSGTNQRYGARGALRVLPESKLRLRNHEFDISEGFVRFEDATKIRADIDVRASTEIRRYAQADTAVTDGITATGGKWDVNAHAHGTSDELKLDLSSEPALAQEDIVLLLTVGMTRAEVDRGLATSLGETLGLEALTALTGADKAVKAVIPIIDYFHFGSTYSSRTGRTEPTVTIGKRLTEDLRANVTTTLTEQDVAATLEWRLQKGVSLEASYDNTNDIGTLVGNVGLDLHWRLEFE
jgi:translocation and assembly module TamB